ncbi:MAG TPA: hypothetical protein VNB46_04495 [Gaiellaceae bacterium]|nr:hypothetical protein [Gaiellaceae bacterium]
MLATAGYAATFTFAVEIVSGPSGTVSVDTAVFSYRANARADFTCSLDDQPELCGASTTDGAKTYTGVQDGEHTFVVEAVRQPVTVEGAAAASAASTVTATRSWVVALPRRLPDTSIVTPHEGELTGSKVAIELSSDTKGATFRCALDSGSFVPCEQESTRTLGDGPHRLETVATSEGGTDPTPAVVHWTVRGSTPPPPPPPPTGPPGLPETRLLSAPSGTVRGREGRFRFSADSPRGARFDCALDEGPFASCSSPAVYVSLDSGRHTFLVRARNAAGIDPTPAAATWTIAAERGWLGWLGLAGLGVLAAGGVVVGVRWGPLHYRRRVWQRRSRTEEPRGDCAVCTRYCRKIELELKPARRRIEALICSAGGEVVARIEGDPVKALNRAVNRYRKQRPTSELRLALQPIAERILDVVGGAAAELDPGPATLHAHLKGGEVECRFELYHCVAGAEGPTWSKEEEWKATVGDEREEWVATPALPLVPGTAFAYLLEDLLTFVTRVDVPTPEAGRALTGP